MDALKKFILPFIAAGSIVAAGAIAPITERQLEFMDTYEGTILTTYVDIADGKTLTVCRGITDKIAPDWVIKGKTYSAAECKIKEVEILNRLAKEMAPLIKEDTSQEQREMLLDFVWNAGINNFKNSTLLKKINMDECFSASDEFKKWVRAGGRVWKGLVSRRAAEADNFRRWCTTSGRMPDVGTN